jgi:hypothetical protein
VVILADLHGWDLKKNETMMPLCIGWLYTPEELKVDSVVDSRNVISLCQREASDKSKKKN